MSEVTTYTPTAQDVATGKAKASAVRKAADTHREVWVDFCNWAAGIRDRYTAVGVKTDVFYAWVLETTGFAKATVADGILYAATLPTLPKGSSDLDKSWVTTLAKAEEKDRAGILEKVASMPAKVRETRDGPNKGKMVPTSARHRKDRLQALALQSYAKANPEKARNAETRKNDRAKTQDQEKLNAALKGMPRVLKAALVAGEGVAFIMAAVEFGEQHGESAILACERVDAERKAKGKEKAPEKELVTA